MHGPRGLVGRPGLEGLVGGALGLRAQAMTGGKRRVVDTVLTPGAGTFTAIITGWHDILLYGPGGTGGSTPGTAASGAGGGGAALKRVWLRAGDEVSYTVATTGSSTTAALAGRFSFSATTGSDGGTGFVPGGGGGVGVGGDINRTGGTGGGSTNPDTDANTNDGVSVLATDGEFGGRGRPSAGAGGGGGGGGGAGFTDLISTLAGDGGNTSVATNPTIPGGGGQGGTAGVAGASGAVAFIYAK